MNTLELKGGMLNMISRVEDEAVLRHLFDAITAIIAENWGEVPDLSPEQEAELELAIEETYNPDNLVDHEEVMKNMARYTNSINKNL